MSEPKEDFLAFPLTFDNPSTNQRYVHTGMTLRDYFAAAALQGMFANPALFATGVLKFHGSNLDTCFEVADAMMKARDEGE